jgi:glycosyltransferase involved in cell wall biosynthesis
MQKQRYGFRIGIIVAARNAAQTIERALQSVVDEVSSAATAAGFEIESVDIVVVDGSSTDETWKIADRFPMVRVIAQAGSGLANARNQGIANVDGDVIAFLDADDRWALDSLSVRLTHLSSEDDVAGVVGHMVTEALPGQSVDVRHRQRIGTSIPAFTPGALVVRRRVFEEVGPFDESLTIAADSDWFIRARGVGTRIDLIDPVVLRKGARSDSLSADVPQYRRELLDVSRRFLEERNKRS